MAMENVPNPITDVSDAAKSLMTPNNDGVFKQFGDNKIIDAPKDFLNSNTLVAKVVFILLILIIFIFLMRLAVTLLHKLMGPSENPVLLPDRISGKSTKSISVNPGKTDSIPILRSNNQDMGMEFSYSTWIFVKDENFSSENTSIKHIFNKGSKGKAASGNLAGFRETNAPGLYLDGNSNKLIVIMDTYETSEKVEIPDIPIQKWVNVIIRLENRHVDIYINGTIVVRHELGNVPKQNYGEVNIHISPGFHGEQSSLRYFNRALTSLEIQRMVQKGPNMTTAGIVTPFPPYLSMRWFLK